MAHEADARNGDGSHVEVLRALAHPVRWGILRRLAAEPGICACDFTEFFDVSQPTISAHLKALRSAGLVATERRGTTICYSLAPGRLESLSRILAEMAATVLPGVPGVPVVSTVPGGPGVPGVPRVSTVPGGPDVPEIPEVPGVLGAAGVSAGEALSGDKR